MTAKEAINILELHNPFLGTDKKLTEAFDMAIKALTAQQWIPCSKRLPSEGENVLLCDTRFGNVSIGRLIRYNTSCCWEVDHWDCDIEDWQAWMPLPEPWKGEQQ